MVSGGPVPFDMVKDFAISHWNKSNPSVLQKSNGVFMFKLESENERDWVMQNGPREIQGSRPITLKIWSPGMPLSWESFETIPVWVACRI